MELRLRLTRTRVVVLVALAAVIGAGIAYAAIPDAGVIHGCYTNKAVQGNHALWVTDGGCPAGSTALDWNKQGPKGDPGTSATSHAYTADKRGSFSGFSSDTPLSVSVSLPAGSYVLTGSIQSMGIQSPLNSQPYCQLRSSGGEFNPPVHVAYASSLTLTATTTLSAPGSAEVRCYFDPNDTLNAAGADIVSIVAVTVGGVN
jgi:hypothetical protein